MALKNILDKDVIFRDITLKKYLRLVKDCLDEDLYEGALIISQIKLEQIIKRIIKYTYKINQISPTSIDIYLDNTAKNINILTNICFQEAYGKNCEQFIIDGLDKSEEKKHFKNLWDNFILSSKTLRNSLIHTGSSSSPASLVFSAINNIYLIDLIRYSFNRSYPHFDIIGKFSKLKVSTKKYKYNTVEDFLGKKKKILLNSRTRSIDFRKLKHTCLSYQVYLKESINAP
ncbi:MAG: hypothetical protein IPH52_10305 [Leptospiraceae bacterium]|nr:hypothetical protein [Leptospiraceae bacterium]